MGRGAVRRVFCVGGSLGLGPRTVCLRPRVPEQSPKSLGTPRPGSACARASCHCILVVRAVGRRGEGRGHCHFKSGEVRPPEVMVTSASSPPPARERERERARERASKLVFIHNFFLFLPRRQLFIPRLSPRGLQRAQLHRGSRRCGDAALQPLPLARCAPAL